MNSHSITDYILKLEKENSESRNKIEQLKKLFTEASEEKVNALNELNDLKYKNRSLFETTARVPVKTPYCKRLTNVGIVERLTELGRMTSDFHKTGAYQNAANTVADLTYTVESGESLMHLNGIGNGIAAKINEYLDELDSDYEGSESSDSESIASNGDESEESDDEESDDDEEDYFISQNAGLAGMLYKCAEKAEDKFKCDAYTKAGDTIYNLSHVITSGKEAIKFPGIGKSIAKKIDDYLNFNNATLAKCFLRLGNHAETQYKSDAYWNASDKLRNLTFNVTCGDDVKHIKGFGPSICSKIDEYITTGTMARLDELN
jgi:DNA polymerase/3'-5' exonuclease PolX